MEAEKAELKSILRGLLISSPKQMTVRELANDFSKQEGREFPYQKYGFRTFVDYLKTIKDTVVLSGCYVTPVVKKSTAHVNDLVLRQKSSSSKKPYYKTLQPQRKRGWVPIVIPPEPAKTLPTLLDIKIPSRKKYMFDATRRSSRNSAYHSFEKLKVDSEYKNVDSAESGNNYASVVYEKDTDSQENTSPHLKSGKKADVFNGLENKMKTVASEPPEKWEDLCEENKGQDDSLFEKYCAQNIKFRSINNIDEWFPKEVPETSPQNSVIASQELECAKNVGSRLEKCEDEIVSRTKNSATEFSETMTDSSFKNEQKYVQRNSTPSSPVPSSESGCNTKQNKLFSEKTVSNMKKLIKDNPQGLWASEFPTVYKECFGVSLDHHAYGYVSMAAVAAAYPDVFICLRRSSADFLLFDSDSPLPKHYANTSANINSCGVVTEVIKKNVERLIAEFPSGLPVERFKEMYKLYFSEELNEEELGFSSLCAMLQTLHDDFILRLRQVAKNTVLYPARNVDPVQQAPPLCNSVMEDDTAEPYTDYPPEVLDPRDNIQRQPLPRHRADFPVLVSDVITPSCFCMILYDLRHQLESLMDEIQFFYTMEGDKYRMPHSAICEGLLCVACYESNQEWHRAQVISTKGGMSKIRIHYIDYGTVGYVKSEELRFMHKDFAHLPMQGITSRLANVKPIADEWTKEVSNYFLDLVRGRYLMAVIDRTNQDNIISVGLVDTSGEDDVHINDQLVLMGYAKFEHEPPRDAPDISTDGSTLELQNGNFEMSNGKSKEKMFHDNEFTNGDDSCPVPSTVTGPTYNNGKGPVPFSGTKKDALPQYTPTVSIEPNEPVQNNFEINNWKLDGKSPHGQTITNGGDGSFVSSTIKEPTCDTWKGPLLSGGAKKDVKKASIDSEKKCQSGISNVSNGSANMWYEKTPCKSPVETKSLEISSLPSKDDIMKVWNASVLIPTPINGTPSISNEGDASLNLKKIPNTWKDVKYSTEIEADFIRNNGNMQLGNNMQTALKCDKKELASHNNVPLLSGNTQTDNSRTTFVPNNSQNESPRSVTAPSNNTQDTSFAQHGLYAHNMWNLGNISVNHPWISSGNNPVVNSISSLVQAGQTWFHPVPNTPQFPLNTFVGVTPLPPPGFTTIQNPFVAFATPQLPAVDPRLSFMYQQQSNPWITSTNNHRSFSNPSGHFFTGNNSGKFVSSTPDIREISQSTENLWSEEESEMGSKDGELEVEASKITVDDPGVKSCGISQCTQTTLDQDILEDTLKSNAQSSERETSNAVSETIIRDEICDKETNVVSDYSMKLENRCKLPDSSTFSENSLQAVLKESPEKIDVENVLSSNLQRLEIDASLGSTTASERILSWETLCPVENSKLDFCAAETNTKEEEEITRCVPSQEVDHITEEKERQPVRHIKKILISGRVLNLINYNEQAYFCTDEFVRSFSKFSGRHVLLKILDTTGTTLPFLEVNRSDNFEMFQMLDNCDLNTKSRKPNGQIHDVLHLVPLKSATDLLKALKVSDVSIISGLMEEVENFNPEDDYWYRD